MPEVSALSGMTVTNENDFLFCDSISFPLFLCVHICVHMYERIHVYPSVMHICVCMHVEARGPPWVLFKARSHTGLEMA